MKSLTNIFKMVRWAVGFPGGSVGKESTCNAVNRRWRFDPQVRKIIWRRTWQPAPIFLLGASHGQRSLEGNNPQGHKQLDMTEMTEHTQERLYQSSLSHNLFYYTDPILEGCSINFPDDQVVSSVTHSHSNQVSLRKHICF